MDSHYCQKGSNTAPSTIIWSDTGCKINQMLPLGVIPASQQLACLILTFNLLRDANVGMLSSRTIPSPMTSIALPRRYNHLSPHALQRTERPARAHLWSSENRAGAALFDRSPRNVQEPKCHPTAKEFDVRDQFIPGSSGDGHWQVDGIWMGMRNALQIYVLDVY